MDHDMDLVMLEHPDKSISMFAAESLSSSMSDYDHHNGLLPATSPSPASDRRRRHPCKYRHTHGCEKTFTTSGHASRHSKIHTAEKAVACSYPDCSKKFTRADNMKQHLETHYKDHKPRQSAVAPARAAKAANAVAAAAASVAVRTARARSGQFQLLPAPQRGATRAAVHRTTSSSSSTSSLSSSSSGLDTLAMATALAWQEQ